MLARGDMAKPTATIDAAGGVIWRLCDSGPQVLMVHRPKYDDWSFPKGKLAAGESHEAGALREVEEETGLRCETGPELASTSYIDRKGRPKRVRYWAMTAVTGRFEPNQEVDEVRWVTIDDAVRLVSYARDRRVITSFVGSLARR
jgi:8-oxo-dGTP diphosphatase